MVQLDISAARRRASPARSRTRACRRIMLKTLIIGSVANAAALTVGASAAPSQVLILGMHHSGTSVIANLTMMLGLYGGTPDEMLLHPANPLKFWERRDVVSLDERRLAAGAGAAADRYEMPDWVAYGFDAAKATAEKIHGSSEAHSILDKLNEHRPWVTKDPRMCLVADEWMKMLDAPLCIIAHREPLSIANSMMIYSHNVSFAEWASVYESYYRNAKRACEGVPTVVVQHDELMREPYKTLQKLHDELKAAGVPKLSMPSEERVAQLLRPSSRAQPDYLLSERAAVGEAAHQVSEAVSKGLSLAASSRSWHVAPRRSAEAFATLLTTANVDYFKGALVLGSSIRSFDSTRDLVALVTASVPAEWHSALEVAGWKVVQVEEVEEFWWAKSPECSKFDGDQSERWGHMATKLRLWQMTQYERIMYMDADAVLTGDASETFSSIVGFGAEKPRYHSYFNAGVMLLTPSQATFDALMALGASEHKSLFGNVIDCTEQGLLNSYFDGTAGREVTKLAVGRADVVADWQAPGSPFAVHWITHVCPKPWLVADGVEELPSHCDPVVYAYWSRLWNRLTSSATDESSSHSVGSREVARRKLRRLAGVSAGGSLVAPRAHHYDSVGEVLVDVQHSIGRQLRQLTTSRRELRRRRAEYDGSGPLTETTWAWIAIIGTLVLGLGAGALLHKLFIKPPAQVGKGMSVVQAKRMGFQALGDKGPVGVVSAVDDDDDDDDDEDEEEAQPPSKK